MTNGDQDGEGEPHHSDFDILLSVVAALCPKRIHVSLPPPGYQGRLVRLGEAKDLDITAISRAVAGLSHRDAQAHVDAEAALKLLGVLERLSYSHKDEAETLRQAITAFVDARWEAMRPSLAGRVIANEDRWTILKCFPALKREPELIERLAELISDTGSLSYFIEDLLREVGPTSIPEARGLIVVMKQRSREDRSALRLMDSLFAAIGRGLGWNAWASLQAILHACPAYATPNARFVLDDMTVSRETNGARAKLAAAIAPQVRVRAVAAVFLDAFGTDKWRDDLLSRPAEVRAAYVDTLDEEIGDDGDLRQAVIEALLWNGGGRSAELAQFAAVALARPEDRAMLGELEQHPERVVRYSARAVRAARYGEPLSVRAFPTPGGLVQSLAALEGGTAPSDEPARTWLGDRAVEKAIEQVIAAEEARFAREYCDHGDEGEDRLLSNLFGALAIRFETLDQLLDSLARATSAKRRASVAMRYRNVDRAEEGGPGIKDAKSFSADLCLIVDPSLDGKSLGRRVTLVQAKRLYRHHRSKKEESWHTSFALDPEQMRDLLAQTHSSVYVFHGPPMGGRGIPVIPTQLVSDLANHQGSGTQIATAMVANASRTLADWLTYDALALRTGDLYQDLVEKADGRAGSLPRRLLALPTLEVDVALVTLDLEV